LELAWAVAAADNPSQQSVEKPNHKNDDELMAYQYVEGVDL